MPEPLARHASLSCTRPRAAIVMRAMAKCSMHTPLLDRSVPRLGYGDVNIIFLHTRARPDATRALGHLIVMASQRPLARGCATCVINLL